MGWVVCIGSNELVGTPLGLALSAKDGCADRLCMLLGTIDGSVDGTNGILGDMLDSELGSIVCIGSNELVDKPLGLELGETDGCADRLGVLLGLIDGPIDGINVMLGDALGSKLGVKDGYEVSVGNSEMVGTALGRKLGSEDG